MSENKFGNEETTGRTEQLPVEAPNETKAFELDDEKPTERVDRPVTEDPATPESSASVGTEVEAEAPIPATTQAEPAEPASPQTSSISEAPETPSFRPENESISPEPGFVGYITAKRGPQAFPNPEPAQPMPPNQPVQPVPTNQPPVPIGHPGIRASTVIVGLILLAIGITALTAQLSGVTFNPAAVALTVMLGAGVTLMSAAIRRTQRR